MPLKGNLNDFGLEEVIQTVFTGKKSGKLEVYGKMGIYGIFFENGKIIHAFGPFTVGEGAIKDAFLEDEGSFIFKQNLILPPRTISKENIEILMECIANRTELLETAKILKKDSQISTSNGLIDDIEISGKEWQILRLLMENKSINEVIKKQNLTFTELNIIIKDLLKKGLIKIGG
jgi:hypothetical protein